MQTSVKRTIADNSISGDAISGGEINSVDAVYTDELYVPSTGTDGLGSIDGNSFIIGGLEPIQSVSANTSFLDVLTINSSNPAFNSIGMFASGTGGTIELHPNGSGALATRLSASFSYFNNKTIFGKDSNDNPAFAAEATSFFADTFQSTNLTSTNSALGNATANDHTATPQSLATDLKLGQLLGSTFADGPYDNLVDPWLTLTGLPAAGAQSVVNIGTNNITNPTWNHVSNMDQRVDTSAPTPRFNNGVYFPGSDSPSNGNRIVQCSTVTQNTTISHLGDTANVTVTAVQVGRLVTFEVSPNPDASSMIEITSGAGGSDTLTIDLSNIVWDDIRPNPPQRNSASLYGFQSMFGMLNTGAAKDADIQLGAYFVSGNIEISAPFNGAGGAVPEQAITLAAGQSVTFARFTITTILDNI
jgi:hypothetical protein